MTYLIRKILIEKNSHCLPDSRAGFAFRLLAESIGTIPIPQFEKEQKEIANKRQLNVNKCIAILNEQKKEAQKKKNPATKTKKMDTKATKAKAA